MQQKIIWKEIFDNRYKSFRIAKWRSFLIAQISAAIIVEYSLSKTTNLVTIFILKHTLFPSKTRIP